MPTDIRAHNRATVLGELLASTPTTRARLAEATGLSTATVTRTIEALIEEGLAHDLYTLPAEGRGRRSVLLEARSDQHLAVGIDIGASNTRLLVVDLSANVIARESLSTPKEAGPLELATWVHREIDSIVGDRAGNLAAAAFGLPGAVNPHTKVVSNAPHLPAVEDQKFRQHIEDRLDGTVDFDNDANYALLGEYYFGTAIGIPNVVMFTIGTGLGAGVLVDGKLLRGRNGLVGEFGSIPVGPMSTRLEHMLTGPSLMLRAEERGLALKSPAAVFEPIASRPVASLRHQYEQSLVVAMTAAAVAADPELIVLGGGISTSLGGSLETLGVELGNNLGVVPRLALAQLGDFSGAYGAAVHALHSVYRGMGVHDYDLPRLPQNKMTATAS